MIRLVNNVRKFTSCTALEYVSGEVTIWVKSHSYSDSEINPNSKSKIYMDRLSTGYYADLPKYGKTWAGSGAR